MGMGGKTTPITCILQFPGFPQCVEHQKSMKMSGQNSKKQKDINKYTYRETPITKTH